MGQFSWLDCVTGKQIIDNKVRDVYVLVPKEFCDEYGVRIKERCYDGYGNFGGYDIYDLVANWNREYLSKHPEHEFGYAKERAKFVAKYKEKHPEYEEHIDFKVSDKGWYKAYANLSNSKEDVLELAKGDCTRWNGFPIEWRTIGIDIACYDEDNATLPYPIKITYDANAIYENCQPSLSDPNQGWECDDEEEEEW